MAHDKRTKSFSARFSVEVVDKLTEHGRRLGQSNARVAERLIDEGLQMEEFPGVVFRTGPTGRRAGVVGGPDVWELVRDLKRAAQEGAADPIDAVCRSTGIDRSKIELAAGYYATYPNAVDDRIRMADEAAERLRTMLADASLA